MLLPLLLHSRCRSLYARLYSSVVPKKTTIADGKLHDVVFDVQIERSSCVVLRIYPSSHRNPIFVVVDGKPIRASRRSAKWWLKGVD